MAESLINPLEDTIYKPQKFIPVDEWIPNEEDIIFRPTKGAIMLNISEYLNIESPNFELDTFVLKVKRSYGTPDMTEHMTRYMNYFEKFYDIDHELLMIYYTIKYLIDYEPDYSVQAFFYDIEKYFMSGSIFFKAGLMNRDNYSLHLNWINKNNPNLQYNDKHGMIMMKISLIMNIIIPLLCHYMYRHPPHNTTEFLLSIYDILLSKFDADIYNKIYETAISNVIQSERRNKTLWNLQDIRGNNITTHALECCKNILINIVPKYKYSLNLVHFNYKSILRSTGYQVLDRVMSHLVVILNANLSNCWKPLRAFLPI